MLLWHHIVCLFSPDTLVSCNRNRKIAAVLTDGLRITAVACLLVTGTAASFGESHKLARLSGTPETDQFALWIFLAGLLVGGLLSDRFGVRVATGTATLLLAIGVLALTGEAGFACLMLGGGIALAVANGLASTLDPVAAGRWLNFIHAFYRGGTLAFGLLLLPIGITAQMGTLFAVAALVLMFWTMDGRSELVLGDLEAQSVSSWPVAAVLPLLFLAGASELWAAHHMIVSLSSDQPNIVLWIALAMVVGRIAASTQVFSGYRQVLVCSAVTAAGLWFFDALSGNARLLMALIVAFSSSSIFPSVLGLMAGRSPRFAASLLAVGQCTVMLAAPLAGAFASFAIVPPLALTIIIAASWFRLDPWNFGRRYPG